LTQVDEAISVPSLLLSTKAALWETGQVIRCGPLVSAAAAKLGFDWDTADEAMVALGEALPAAVAGLVGPEGALGLDETLFMHTCLF
jgi:hypothetical protein